MSSSLLRRYLDILNERNITEGRPGQFDLGIDVNVFFKTGPTGKVIKKVMMGNSDVTHIVDADQVAKEIEDSTTSPDVATLEFNVDVDYQFHGKHRPATYFDPEEHPEFEIHQLVIHGPKGRAVVHADDIGQKNIDRIEDSLRNNKGNDSYPEPDHRY